MFVVIKVLVENMRHEHVPAAFIECKDKDFSRASMLKGVNSHICHEPFTSAVCFNVIITDFALCFFMVLDLRLKIVGCRETADFSFL